MFAFSGEHIFAQSMIHLGIQNIGGGRHSDQAHSPRPTYILHRNDAHKSRGVKQSTYRQYVQCTYYYLPTTTCQQYVLHIYLDFDFVRLGSGRITSSYVTRTRRAQARKPKLVLLIKTQVAVLFTTCTASKQTTKRSSFSNFGKFELHFKISTQAMVNW